MKIPRHYQEQAINKGIAGNLLCTDQMGLGKSLVAIEIAKQIFNKYDAPALIICPKGIREQWCSMILDQDIKAEVWVLENGAFDTLKYAEYILADYLIIHYEGVTKYIDILKQFPYSTIIIDEAHRIKNHGTQSKPVLRTRAIKQLRAYRKVGLTGTPFDKNPAEYWSLLNWLAPKEFKSKWDFIEKYIDFDVDYFGYKTNFRVKNPQQFAEMLAPYVLGRKKRDVLPELPLLQITHIPIALNPDQRKVYDQIRAVKDLDTTIDDQEIIVKNALSKLVKLHQLASDPYTLGLNVSSAKLDWLLEWFSDNPTTPTLVFTRYRKAAERVHQTIMGDCLVMGDQSPQARLAVHRGL